MSVRVGLNAMFLRPTANGGIETYLRELVAAHGRINKDIDFVLFVPSEARLYALDLPENFERVVVPWRAANPTIRYIGEQLVLPWWVMKRGVHVLHSLAYVGPIGIPCASLVTIHDLNFLERVTQMGYLRRLLLGTICYGTGLFADHVIAVSEFTRSEVIRWLGYPGSAVITIHEAGRSSSPDRATGSISSAGLVKGKYLFAFGGRFANKNIDRLIAAYVKIADKAQLDLVIVGEINPAFKATLDLAPVGIRSRIHALGYCDDAVVEQLMRGARVYVHPSLYEGFGMPVIEAQALGIVVACSDRGSLPEIGGAGAIYFNPLSVSDIAEKIYIAACCDKTRGTILVSASENLKRFSWNAAARATGQVYRCTYRDRVAQGATQVI